MAYKNLIVSPEFPNGKEVNYTQAQIDECKAVKPIEDARLKQEKADLVKREDLKASAKAKLIAGEKLTEEEADILFGV